MALYDPSKRIKKHGEDKVIKFEEQSVLNVLKHFNMTNRKWELIEAEETETGDRRLRFHRFYEQFPTFPIYLTCAAPTNLAKHCSVHLLLSEFRGRPLFQAWDDSRDRIPRHFNSDYYGIVIRWPYVKYPMVFHNMGDNGTHGFKLIYRMRDSRYDAEMTMCLEPFKKFLQDLEWDLYDE